MNEQLLLGIVLLLEERARRKAEEFLNDQSRFMPKATAGLLWESAGDKLICGEAKRGALQWASDAAEREVLIIRPKQE